jgi:hypothetical protein
MSMEEEAVKVYREDEKTEEKEGIKTENEIIKEKLEMYLSDPETRQKTLDDFTKSFSIVGLDEESAIALAEQIIEIMELPISMEESEKKGRELFDQHSIDGKPFIDCITEKFSGRAERIYEQVSPYFEDIHGKVIDYGAGNGQVTQLLHDKSGLDIEGVDVSDFRAPGVTIAIKIFDGKHTSMPDDYYEAALMTNVAHHEKDNERIIEELTRIVNRRLVIIETVPAGETPEEIEKDRGRTFLTDTLWNRYFWNANIPVPGTYETPEGWIARFQKHGWKIVKSMDLGIDQPVVQDVHHLLILEK